LLLVTVQCNPNLNQSLALHNSYRTMSSTDIHSLHENRLFITALSETAGLGVEILVALNSPVHCSVGGNEGRNNVEDLVPEAAERVEDGGVSSAGEGSLTVRGDSVGSDALGSWAT
jgi:hypothetical protein